MHQNRSQGIFYHVWLVFQKCILIFLQRIYHITAMKTPLKTDDANLVAPCDTTGCQKYMYNTRSCRWRRSRHHHYSDVIMSTMASQIASLTIVYPTVDSGADQQKHQSSASLAFVRANHRWPMNSPHKGPVMPKKFPFDDVIVMTALRFQWRGLKLLGVGMPILLMWTSVLGLCSKCMTRDIVITMRDNYGCDHQHNRTAPWQKYQGHTFSHNLPFVRRIHRSLVHSPHKMSVLWSFDVCFVIRLSKRLNKQLSLSYPRRHDVHVISL